MKHLIFSLLLAFPGVVSAQYFNIFPTICTASGNEYHYTVHGVEAFTDSLPLILHAELLTNDEQLDLIDSRVYDLTDTLTFQGLSIDSVNHIFILDLGNHSTNNYLLHMWVAIGGSRYDEIYYQQP